MKTKKGDIARVFFLAVLAFFSFQAAAAATDPDGNGQGRSAIIYSVSVEPAKVAVGETILIEAVFSVFDDNSRGSLPMEYFCEIERQGHLIFKSPVREMDVTNGAKSRLEVKLQAVGAEGDYRVALEMIRPDGNIRKEGGFSIVSSMEARMYRDELLKRNPSIKSAVENRLPGKWQFIPRNTETSGTELTISKENGQLTAQVSRRDTETLWVKLRKTENGLTVRSKSAALDGECWYVVEDVITFNDRMDDMPVRSKVLEGSRCVSVGQVSEATLCRME